MPAKRGTPGPVVGNGIPFFVLKPRCALRYRPNGHKVLCDIGFRTEPSAASLPTHELKLQTIRDFVGAQ
jgi:hypothetical protein